MHRLKQLRNLGEKLKDTVSKVTKKQLLIALLAGGLTYGGTSLYKNMNQDNTQQTEIILKPTEGTYYNAINEYIKKGIEEGILKEGSLNMYREILSSNGMDTNTGTTNGPDTVFISSDLLQEYIIPENVKGYSHKKIDLHQENKTLWKISEEFLNGDKAYLDIEDMDMYKESLKKQEPFNEIKNVLRQTILEATEYYNKAHIHGRSIDNANTLLIPSMDWINYFDENYNTISKEKIEVTAEETTIEEKEVLKGIGKYYVNPKFDKYANKVLEEYDGEVKVIHFKNKTLEKSLKSNGLGKAEGILIHGTAGKYDETKNGYKKMTAHFYIDSEGNIYQSGTKQVSGSNLDLGKTIVQLNHGGVGNGKKRGKRFGASRNGDENITYKLIGIEVEQTNKEFTYKQYQALNKLLRKLSNSYNIKQKDILLHSQIACSKYGRGRKSDPILFDYRRAGLNVNPYNLRDKDVEKGIINSNIKTIETELKSKFNFTNSQISNHVEGLKASRNISKSNKKGVAIGNNPFQYLRVSNNGKYKVYSYTIKQGGTPGGVQNAFLRINNKVRKNTILVTNADGDEYPHGQKIPKGTKVYVKIPK